MRANGLGDHSPVLRGLGLREVVAPERMSAVLLASRTEGRGTLTNCQRCRIEVRAVGAGCASTRSLSENEA